MSEGARNLADLSREEQLELLEYAAYLRELEGQRAAEMTSFALLVQALEMPEGSTPEDVAKRLQELDIAPDEIETWLTACEYDPECFRAEVYFQLRQGRKRTRAAAVMLWATVGAVVAVGAGLAVWRRR